MQVNFQTTLSVSQYYIKSVYTDKQLPLEKALYNLVLGQSIPQNIFLITDSLIGGVFSVLWGL